MKANLQKIHPNAAGIDIGSEKVFVSVPGQEVKSFRTYTKDLYACCHYLKSHGITTVAMEATGVYWIPLFEIIEKEGMEPFLVNGAHVKNVPGRKSDVKDCQWLQELHSYGLLKQSFIPEEQMRKLRCYVRLRDDHIRMASSHIQHIQKALDQMNIKLHTVISQIMGASGLRIIRAILKGERDAEKLALLCDKQIRKKKHAQVVLSLQGNYKEEHLFALRQALTSWEFYGTQIKECDKQTEDLLTELTCHKPEQEVKGEEKPIRHHKPEIADLHQMLLKLTDGKDGSQVPGLTDLSFMKIIAETGTDMSKWKTAKHFTSWPGLSPGIHSSGKTKKKRKKRIKTKAGQIFRIAAQSVGQSKYLGLNGFYKRINAKKGAKVAIAATARKIAVLFYNTLRYGLEYVEQGLEAYQEKYKQAQIKYIMKKAKEFNLMVTPVF